MEKNRKIRRKWKMVVAIVFVLAVMIGIGLEGEERSVEGEPDVISSMIVNNEQYLTVVANRNEIEKEEEFKKLLIRMYEENSFHCRRSIKKSYAGIRNCVCESQKCI